MPVEIAVRHGPYTFRVTGDDLKDAVMKMSALQELPRLCPRCNAHLRFVYRTAGKHSFYGLECLGEEPHAVDLGQYQDDPRQLYFDRSKPWRTRAEIASERNAN
jgi:hypothetical protein